MATNFVRVKYSEIIDLNTMPGDLTILGIHTPCNSQPYFQLAGFFNNYRKFRYTGCSFTMAPAAQLPMDPLGVGYEAGENQVDPRDLLNPILFHGAHGDTLTSAFDTAYKNGSNFGASIDRHDLQVEGSGTDVLGAYGTKSYYDALADPTWRKFGVMSPIRIGGLHPLVHKMVSIMPVSPPRNGTVNVNPDQNVENGYNDGSQVLFLDKIYGLNKQSISGGTALGPTVSGIPQQIYTNGVTRLGWLDTMPENPRGTTSDLNGRFPYPGNLPRAFMGVMILPPAYSVKMCYRIVIHHYFQFKGFTTCTRGRITEFSVPYYNGFDESVIPEPASLDTEMTTDVQEDLTSIESNGDINLVTTTVS